MILLKKAYHLFFLIGIIMLPFSSEVPEWFGFLGAYANISSSFFFLVGVMLLFLYFVLGGKIYLPIKSTDYSLFLLFLVAICICTLVNLPTILDYYFKQTTGVVRFVRQLLSALLGGVAIFLLFINVCRDYGAIKFFRRIRKIFFLTFILVFVCGMLQFFTVTFHLGFLEPVVYLFDYLPFVNVHLDYRMQRLASTTFEPPALGTYLITISGFLFSYILTSKKIIRFLPFLMVVILAVLSKSRMALVVIIFQVVIGVFFAYLKYANFRNFFNKMVVLGAIGGLFVLLFFWNPISTTVSEKISSLDFTKVEYNAEDNSVSNKSRFGIQYAMLQVLKENPIFGVGWGQQAYEARFHYPKWATEHNYEFSTRYLNEQDKDFPPTFNMYLRILTESGIVGFFVFMIFLCSILLSTFLVYRKSKHQDIAIALFIGFGGFLLDWLQIDSFKLYGFWLCLAILIILKKEYYESRNRFDSTL